MALRNPGSLPEKAKPGELLLVIHDFEARSSDELSLTKGDKIQLIERDDEFGDGWYLGKHTTTGKNGLFPEVYTTLAPKPPRIASDTGLSLASLATGPASNIHPSISHVQSVPDRVAAASATPPPLNTTPPGHKTISVPNASTTASALADVPAVQRSISMVQGDGAEDSPVMNETLSVIDEHMTDMNNPQAMLHDRRPTNDSASEYSSFVDHRISYIAGQETDEEEGNLFSEEEVKRWTPQRVAEHLEDMGVDRAHCSIFREQDITGEVLLDMDQTTIFMKEFDLGLVGPRLRTWHKIKAFQDEVRSNRGSHSKPKAVFNGDRAFRNAEPANVAASTARSANTRQSRASTNPAPSRQEFADPQPSPSLILAQSLSRDSNSTPSSFTFKSGLDSPSRPSAASIRDFNHSRRHSTIEYGSSFGQHTPTEQNSPALPQMPQTRASVHSPHKKNPSFDQNWGDGTPPPSAGGRSQSSTNIANSFLADRRTPDPATQRASHAPSSSHDLDRGYKSGDELDAKRARNVLRKHRESMSASHSRQSSYQADMRSPTAAAARRHSRFGSVDSIRDTMAAITSPASRVRSGSARGHSRKSSANEAIVKADAPQSDTGTPVVTRLEYNNKPNMKITTSSSRDSGIGLSVSPRSPTTKTASKPRMGLRAISDAVTGNEKTIATSPTSVPSPIKRSSNQSPARTGSTSPSGASQSLDRESTDASSKGTSGAQTGQTPVLGPRRKSKKETSAYTRGLEQKTPQEQLIDCDYSGWMKKKSSNLVTTWKPRLFVLRGRRLSYYYTEEDTSEKGLIDISSHRVLPADHDIFTGIHATVTGAKSSPVSPPTAHTPTLAAAEAAAQTESSLQKGPADATFIFKLVPPRSGLTRAVNFTKPTVHYFAVDNVRQGRLWMAALMKATIDRDESKPITTSYQLKTISLAKARNMKQRPPALMNLDEQSEPIQEGPKSDETGLNIQGVDYDNLDASSKRTGSLDDVTRQSDSAKDDKSQKEEPTPDVAA